MAESKTLSLEAAARKLGVPVPEVRRLIVEGQLQAFKVAGQVHITRRSVEAWLRRQRAEPYHLRRST